RFAFDAASPDLISNWPTQLFIAAQPRRIERRQPAGIERRQVHRVRGAVDDQLRYRLARRGCVENAPDAMPGGNKGAGYSWDGSDQRKPVRGHRTKARLPR